MNLPRTTVLAFLVLAVGCSAKHSRTDVERGRKALEAALESWKNNEPSDRLKAGPEPIDYSDELRQSHRLLEYTVGKPNATDPDVIRYAVTVKLQDRKGKIESRDIVYMVALKSPIVIARDPYE